MTSIAIVGFSNLTLPYVKDSKVDEIWTLNHAYKVIGDVIPRTDRLFEMHKRNWFARKELPPAQEYLKWLRRKHPFPIYMQRRYKSIPSSVKYPFKEIVQDLFGKFTRGGEVVKYFTSSFSYMMALAIYEKVEKIEIYGIEMRSDTEYKYQKPAGEFMVGVALGRGIEVVLPPKSHVCLGLVYGYEYIPWADKKTMREHYESYSNKMIEMLEERDRAVNQYQEYASKPDADQDELIRRANIYSAAAGRYAAYAGAANNLKRLLDESDYWASRQKLESRKGEARVQVEKWKAETNFTRAQYNTFISEPGYDETKSLELWKQYEDAYHNMHLFSGILQSIEKLLDVCDMQVVNLDLEQMIEDK